MLCIGPFKECEKYGRRREKKVVFVRRAHIGCDK